jgi:hypothetical protein
MWKFWRFAGIRAVFLMVAFTLLTVMVRSQEVKVVTMSKYISSCLYNFSRYINWPAENKTGDFIITIVGSKEVYAEMTKLTQNRKVGLQAIQVKYCTSVNEISGFQHIVFVDSWQSGKISQVLQKTSGYNTLVVTENDGMIDRGAMINFIPVNGTMQFEIDRESLAKSNLTASSVLERMSVNSN